MKCTGASKDSTLCHVAPLYATTLSHHFCLPGASLPICQHANGQRLPTTGSSGGSSGCHWTKPGRAGGGNGAAVGP